VRTRYPRYVNIGPADSPEGSCERGVKSLNNGESNLILAQDNKSRCYKAGLPEWVYARVLRELKFFVRSRPAPASI